jgi:glycyl-tRNA synthetase beta chain
VSIAVALAEKIDKLTGFWAIDEKPTGSKDPFALRRAALGVIRILVENDVSLSILPSVEKSYVQHLLSEHSRGNEVYFVSTEKKLDDGWTNFVTILAAFSDDYPQLEREKYGDLLTPDRNEPVFLVPLGTEGPKGSFAARTMDSLGYIDTRQPISSISSDLLSFLHDRLKVYLKDQGVRHDIIDACISSSDGAPAGATDGNDDLTLLVKRAKALSETLKTDDGENLIQGFKRANNILSQAEDADGVEYSFGADIKFAETEEERALFAALDAAEAQIKPAMEAQDFGTAMSAMASLRGPIDAFFDAVQVNSDNATVRRNRLNLLSRIRTICSSVADLTKIDG